RPQDTKWRRRRNACLCIAPHTPSGGGRQHDTGISGMDANPFDSAPRETRGGEESPTHAAISRLHHADARVADPSSVGFTGTQINGLRIAGSERDGPRGKGRPVVATRKPVPAAIAGLPHATIAITGQPMIRIGRINGDGGNPAVLDTFPGNVGP